VKSSSPAEFAGRKCAAAKRCCEAQIAMPKATQSKTAALLPMPVNVLLSAARQKTTGQPESIKLHNSKLTYQGWA